MRTGFWLESLKEIYQWEDDTKMDLREIGWGGMAWIHLIHLIQNGDQWRALVKMVMNLRVA
jgi:hypothetical protein